MIRQVDLPAELAALARRRINYDEADAPSGQDPGSWHVDESTAWLAREKPGAPEPGGAWDIACTLVRHYEFADARLIRAVYRPDVELMGRDMLLEGRFWGLRFHMGVRVTQVVDVSRDDERIWGWGYQTLEGHLEQGKLIYEVVKSVPTGAVELVLSAYSRPAPISNPLIRTGFGVFGRHMQLRFYAEVGRRLRRQVQSIVRGGPAPTVARTPEGLVRAPSGSAPHPLELFTIDARHSGG